MQNLFHSHTVSLTGHWHWAAWQCQWHCQSPTDPYMHWPSQFSGSATHSDSGRGGSVVRACDWQSSGRGFESCWGRLETLAISFTPLCQCLSEETLKAVGHFYLVSMPGEVKYPISLHWKCVLSWTPLPTLPPPTCNKPHTLTLEGCRNRDSVSVSQWVIFTLAGLNY